MPQDRKQTVSSLQTQDSMLLVSLHVHCVNACLSLHRLGIPGSASELHIFKVGRQMEHAASRRGVFPQAHSQGLLPFQLTLLQNLS